MQKCDTPIGCLFETSWEVCNKIGGIYAVLSTKAAELKAMLGDNLVFIGPDVWSAEKPCPVFKERKSLLRSAASKLLLPYSIKIRAGRWDVPGQPVAVLVDFQGMYAHLPEYYGKMWEHFGVDSLHSYGDYDEGCAFALAASIVMKELAAYLKPKGKVLAHFNEWTTGMGLLNLKLDAPDIATLFTTHATSIGRSICGNGKKLYDYFDGYNGDQMAVELNMQSKHSLEKAAAHQADCFTTVSEVTARECRQLLDIDPQVITPNGFEAGFVPDSKSLAAQRRRSRARLLGIARALTGAAIPDETLIVATSGRNEYRNKGIDLFIDAVESADAPNVLAFIMVPAWVKAPQAGIVESMEGVLCEPPALPFCTHRLNNEESDSIFRRLKSSKSKNIIYLPCYLDGHDGVLDLPYYEMLPGLDLTVFPSYYEPWGYTPLESIAFGVPTVTSDKAGFGQWVLSEHPGGFALTGVEVVARTDSNYDEARREIAARINQMASESVLRKESRLAAARTASAAEWRIFIAAYRQAFETAILRNERND